jgi:iron complex transport system permease protein
MNRNLLAWSIAIPATLVTFVVALAVGSEPIAFSDAINVMAVKLGIANVGGVDLTTDRIIWQLRMPRILLAAAVGGGLSIVGVAMQTLVRNPLAEPYILGVSGGASTGASLFYLGFLPPILSQTLSMPIAAFVGALLAMVLVYVVARTGFAINTGRLLLAGVAVGALLAAVTSFVTIASPSPQRMRAVLFWLLGSFGGARWSVIGIPIGASLAGLLVLIGLSRSMDAMLMGEEPAQSLGVPVESTKRLLILITALVTGALVSVSGIIGFVGLIIPHSIRLVAGVTHRTLLPLSFVAGSLFLVWADLAARTVIPHEELPIGILTAVCGVPFFLVLLRRAPRGFV